MSNKIIIQTCPTCGSDALEWVVKDVIRQYKGEAYTVPDLAFYECPQCGERVYDREAIQKIQAYSPAYHHDHALAEA